METSVPSKKEYKHRYIKVTINGKKQSIFI